MNHNHTFQRPQPTPESPRKPPRLDLYMPATPPLASLSVLEFWVRMVWRRLRFRHRSAPLLKASDTVLQDVGLERSDIEWALNLPLKVDALKALARCRRARRQHLEEQYGKRPCSPDGAEGTAITATGKPAPASSDRSPRGATVAPGC
ncbi:hypothetical protein ACJO2E_08215 [Marinobacter sp. M1N3S26]|uniref:hypothetical protein n=1 Tax=Marinobacter sp. M1N3S26 TaxID=3382299 RepID=UPI00387B930D